LSGTTVDDINFTPEENKRWKKLEAAEKKQEQSRQNSDGSGNDEQKFAACFAAANKRIDELMSDAREKKDNIETDLKRSIKEVVQELASNLESRISC
jgi:flagellar hook-basal body complex protein FliE